MSTKTMKARLQMKIDTAEHWASATTFVPLKGEIIFTTNEYGKVIEMRIGDGQTLYSNLAPFADSDDANTTYQLLTTTGGIIQLKGTNGDDYKVTLEGTGITIDSDTEGNITFTNAGVTSITQDTTDGHKLTIITNGVSKTITIPDNNDNDDHITKLQNSPTIEVNESISGQSIQYAPMVKLSADTGNRLEAKEDGLYIAVEESTGATYDLILGTEGDEAGKLVLVGSDGSRDIVELPGDIAQGEAEGTLISGVNAQAISQGSTAMGVNVSAGTKAFYIEAIDKENKKIYLRTESVDGVATIPAEAARQGVGTTTSYDTGYAENDEFSVINGTHYAFCGTITTISDNVITYEPKVRFTSNIEATGVTSDYTSRFVEISEAFSTIATVDSTEYWKEYIFWVPAKPECGFIIQNTDGEQYFQGAQTLGDNNKASANAAFVIGTDNIAGGKGASILGTRNRGGYSALTSGGDNVCLGQHSATIGRNLFNSSDYSALTGRCNMCLSPSGNYGNFIAGFNNIITSGSNVSLFGQGHKCGETNGARFGKYSLDNADIFSIGIGDSNTSRKNAMSILEDGSTFFYGGTTLIGGAYVEPVYDNKLILNFRNEDEYKLSTSSSNGGGYYVAAGTNGALNWSKPTKSAQYTTTANSTNWFQRYNASGFASGLIYPYVKLRYRTTAESQSGGQPRTALLWRTLSKAGDNGAKPVAGDYVDLNNNKDVYLINDGEWHDIIYCLTDSSNWVDISDPTIILLRQAFYTGLTGPVEIAQFGLFKTLKEAQSAATIDEIATKTWVEKNGGGTVDESQVREIVEDMLLNGEW